jgi:hypothetical protein
MNQFRKESVRAEAYERHYQCRGEESGSLRRVMLISSMIGLILHAGCSMGSGSAESDSGPVPKPIEMKEEASVEGDLTTLVEKATRGTTVDQLQAWALKTIDQAYPLEGAGMRPIDVLPKFLREFDPPHGDPQHGNAPVVWVIWEDEKAQVTVTWANHEGCFWGFYVGRPGLLPPPGFLGILFKELRPGVFAYYFMPNTSGEKN